MLKHLLILATIAGLAACKTIEDDYGFPADLWEKIDNEAQGGN